MRRIHPDLQVSRPPGKFLARRGFTLVEVMMAAGVLALALVTSITTLQRSFTSLDSARNIETACRIMQCELEKERLFTWAQVSDLTYLPAIDAALLSDPTVAGRFSLARSVTTLPDHSGRLLQVTVTVTWRNYNGRSMRRSLTTYIGNDGLSTYFNSPG